MCVHPSKEGYVGKVDQEEYVVYIQIKGKEGYVRKVDQEEYVVYIQVKKVMYPSKEGYVNG